MAQDCSFDIVSEIDLQIIDDVVNVAMKEINNRFDLKGQNATIEFSRGEKTVTFHAPSEFQIKQIKDVLNLKMAKRDVSTKAFKIKKTEKGTGGAIKEINEVVCGIDKELAKEITKDIKGLSVKVQSSIQDEKIRVTGKNKDDLQVVIHALREKDYPISLQFANYR